MNTIDCSFRPQSIPLLFFVMLCALMLITQPSSAKGTQQQTAKKATNKGLALYKQKKYALALEQFKQAIEIDPQSASAHWNIARSLGMLRLKAKHCKYKAKKSIIIQHVFKACRLRPRLKRRLRRERAFRTVHDTMAWQRLMGLSPDSTKRVRRILMNVSWYGPASNEGAPSAGIDFRAKGKLMLWTKSSNNELGRQSFQGKWRVQRNRVFIELTKPFNDKKRFEGELKQVGQLWLPGLPAPFTDDPLLCNKKGQENKQKEPAE